MITLRGERTEIDEETIGSFTWEEKGARRTPENESVLRKKGLVSSEGSTRTLQKRNESKALRSTE